MRHASAVIATCISLLVLAMQPAASQSATPVVADTMATSNQSDAAEKHVKRTACLKDAKTKKLVGAQKTAFLKDCMATDATGPLASASAGAPG